MFFKAVATRSQLCKFAYIGQAVLIPNLNAQKQLMPVSSMWPIGSLVGRCSTLSHLNKDTIRLRYRDDEGSYIILSIYDGSIDDMCKFQERISKG